EGNAPIPPFDLQHHDFDELADVKYFRWMRDLFGPRHLGDMDQAFDPALELDERAVIHDADPFSLTPGPDRILVRHFVPRVGCELLHAKRDPLFFGIEFQYD